MEWVVVFVEWVVVFVMTGPSVLSATGRDSPGNASVFCPEVRSAVPLAAPGCGIIRAVVNGVR